MIDRLFTAVLAFTLLAGGTAAVGSAFLGEPAAHPQAAAQRLPTVEVLVDRVAAAGAPARAQ
jgi:hypothetical protein